MTTAIPPIETMVQGDPDHPVLFFIHGWPDDASLWRKQFEALSDRFYCIAVTLPNFGNRSLRRGGFDFPQLADALAETICRDAPAGKPVNLVTHDWGAYLGYLLQRRHPQLVARMVALDVGGHAKPDTLKSTLFIIAYQWSLILFWLIGGLLPPLGDWLCRVLGRIVRVPSRQRAHLKSRYGYLYFYFWRGTLFKHWNSSLLGYYEPTCPVLYLFGEAKPVMFHSGRWLQIVENTGGRWEGIPGAGHWFMETHPAQVNQAILEWCAVGQPGDENR